MISKLKNVVKHQLLIEAEGVTKNDSSTNRWVTLSLKRSGQHAVINWLCYQLQEVAHYNHCYLKRMGMSYKITPENCRVISYKNSEKNDSGVQSAFAMRKFISVIGTHKNILHSFEDHDSGNRQIGKYVAKRQAKVILIIRDPYNWLASRLKRNERDEELLKEKVLIMKRYLEQALLISDYINGEPIAINYNKWAVHKDYRREVCNRLVIPFSETADQSMEQVPDFGGGSSFTGTAPQEKKATNYFERWKEFEQDPLFRKLLNDEYLEELSESFFGIARPY